MNGSYMSKKIAFGTALLLAVALAHAADDLPKAETILDKYVEATGGKAAYEKHHTEISKGTMEIKARSFPIGPSRARTTRKSTWELSARCAMARMATYSGRFLP
jgi:hypothetical protein